MAVTDPPLVLTRAQVLGYRAAVHGLRGAATEGVLLAGVQDSPPGRTASAALRVRGADVDPAEVVLVHSLRAAPHLHRVADIGLLTAALHALELGDLAREMFGPLAQELPEQGVNLAWAVDHVAGEMRQVCADEKPRTKSELSTALNELVDPRLRPWCGRCGAHHVQDVLFRYSTLQAGLSLAAQPTGFQYVPHPDPGPLPDPAESQTTLVRRFLRLTGPCRPEDLARWLALTPAAARRLWRKLDGQLTALTVDGRKSWAHQQDLDALRSASAATEVRLLPPYDPLTELADREFLAPDRAQRSAVWRPVGSPGVLLVRGEFAGTVRHRSDARRTTITIEPFGRLAAADRTAALRSAEDLAEPGGPPVEATVAP